MQRSGWIELLDLKVDVWTVAREVRDGGGKEG
jgi:hypothetical protein